MKRILVAACAVLACSAAHGAAPKFKQLHRFGKTSGDGADPTNVVVGKRSVLYGVTQNGGANSRGTVFSLTPPSSPDGTWKEAILYNFAGGSDGNEPGSAVEGASGVLNGVTYYGGNVGCSEGDGCGTVFSLTPPASPGGAWTEAVIYRFQGGATDGSFPWDELTIGSGGVLYGVTSNGGSAECGGFGCGAVFSLTPPASPGGSWTEAVLYSFGDTGIGTPSGPTGVVVGSDGTLYGALNQGGESAPNCGAVGCGTVFSLTPPAYPGGPWTPATLYTFTGGTDGGGPTGRVVIGPGGVLYGAVIAGGSEGGGAVFTLTPPASPGGPWTEAMLFNFPVSGSGGAKPNGVVLAGSGKIYGTTENGGSPDCMGEGTQGCGVVFLLTPPASPGGAWTDDALYKFSSGPAPGPLVLKKGVLYGVDGYRTGEVFSLKP